MCKLVAVLRRHVCSLSMWRACQVARYVLQKYTKSWGWLPPMPHFLFGGRNILNVCGWWMGVNALLIIYGEVVLVGRDGVGWCANGTPYYVR